jgi:hypothetical protein
MISSKAIDLLRTFNEPEFRRFGIFLSSPYFRGEKIQVKFYALLKKYYPQFDHKNFDKEKLYSKLYPGRKYNDGVMRNILSDTLDLAQKFLIVEKTMKMGQNSLLILLEELSSRKQSKLFARVDSELNSMIEKKEIKDEDYFYGKFLLEAERRRSRIKRKSTIEVPGDHLKLMADYLTNSFLINILRINSFLANTNRNILKYNFDPFLISEIESLYSGYPERFKNLTYVNYLFNTLKLAQTEEERYFFGLKSIMENEYDNLRDSDKSDIFTLLTNYCYLKVNKGHLNFMQENYKLHKEHIERGYYKGEKGYLSHIMYINVTVTGLESGESDWVYKFLDKYKEELDDINRENSYNFCKALYYYHSKEYNRSIALAAKVSTDDLSYKHQLKSLYLKIYFDMNEAEQFYNHIDSYYHFLANQKNIPQVTRDIIKSYVSYSKKLFDIKENEAERDFELFKLKKEITENKSMINKQWLLDRIDKIEKI